jgi:hypothetical protein
MASRWLDGAIDWHVRRTVMLESEKFAIAAHLHVVMRRVHGRVTDVEWMIKSADYAREIIRVARGHGHTDLLKLADKLEAALLPPIPAARPATGPASRPMFVATDPGDSSGFSESAFAPSGSTVPGGAGATTGGRKRYVGTLR